jgi:hypothetical protein
MPGACGTLAQPTKNTSQDALLKGLNCYLRRLHLSYLAERKWPLYKKGPQARTRLKSRSRAFTWASGPNDGGVGGPGASPGRLKCEKIRTFFCRYHVNLSVKVNRDLVTSAAEKRPFRHSLCRPKRIGEVNCWNLPQLYATIFHISHPKRPHQIICSLPHGDYENDQKLKATLVDKIRRAHTEDTCAKENPSGENRSDSEAHRRCYSAKGVQPGIVARFTSGLISWSPSQEKPRQWWGFFVRGRFGRSPMRIPSGSRRKPSPGWCAGVRHGQENKISA